MAPLPTDSAAVPTDSAPRPRIPPPGSSPSSRSPAPPGRGRQYGEAVRPQLHAALGYYEEAFGRSAGLTWDQVTARAARWLEPVRAYAPTSWRRWRASPTAPAPGCWTSSR